MIHKGSCHCGRIAFEVDADITEVMDCNCSMCQRRGGLLFFTPATKLKLLTPEENLSTYKFNKKTISHHFCNQCGIAPLSRAGDQAAINVRCLEGINLESLKVKKVDGRSF